MYADIFEYLLFPMCLAYVQLPAQVEEKKIQRKKKLGKKTCYFPLSFFLVYFEANQSIRRNFFIPSKYILS